MNWATLRRRASTWAILLGCGIALVRCGSDRVAGSSVTTGNPTEIQVSFTGENGPMALTGRIDVYGATQIPIPGFRPEPLASFVLDGEEEFRLHADHFRGIADSMWPEGSLVGDSLARFNLVVTGEGQAAVLRDLSLRKKDKDFLVGALSTLAAPYSTVASLDAALMALREYKAFIDPSTLDSTRMHYLFLKGTGFAARATGGAFRFPGLPEGNQSVSYLTVPDPDRGNMSPEDSAYVFSLDRPIASLGTDTLKVTDLDFQLKMPDSFKK